jgi:asparagine synthase (glutamine-hydrolysing)
MCGIAGFIAPPSARVDQRVLERMVAALRHRGPDTVGYHVDGRVALGAARLRVIDLETGDQPIANEDASVHVVQNGEIYNFNVLQRDLTARGHRFVTRSDTEAIVHAWEEYGEHCIDHFNGMFAFALWDSKRQQLLLARDRMGEKPLYYAATGGWIVFASELHAVLAHPVISRELDLPAVSRYLAYDFVPAPYSMIRGVAKLPPGHALIVTHDKIATWRYWDIPFRPESTVDAPTWRNEIRWRLDEAVRLRMASDVPLGCFLSGGIDSTAVTATAARQRAGIRTFSVGYAEARFDERPFARLVAERYGTQHEELVVSATDAGRLLPQIGTLLDEPLADMSFVPLHLLARAARRSVTVALTGDGGDELFAGYPTMAADWWHRLTDRLPGSIRSAFERGARGLPGVPEGLREFLRVLSYRPEARNQALLGGMAAERHRSLLAPAVRAGLAGFEPYVDIEDTLAGCPTADVTARLIYRYCKLYLAGQNLANADRASMAASLELRAPLLDHTFVEFVGRIPSPLRARGFFGLKRLFKEAMTDRFPPEILARGKQGFGVPFGAWFRGPLAGTLAEALAPDRVRAGGVLDAEAVRRLVVEHVGGVRDHRRILWALLVFESWRAHHFGTGT